MSVPPNKHLLTDGNSSSSKKKAKYQDAGDPDVFLGFESALANTPPMSSSFICGDLSSRNVDDEDPSLSLPLPSNISAKTTPALRVSKPFFSDPPKRDPQVILNDAWGKLKPAIRTIFLDEPAHFHPTELLRAAQDAWWTRSLGEDLYKLILEECGIYISEAIQSLESRCDDDPSVFLPLMEKCWLDLRGKLQYICKFAGGGHRIGLKSLLGLGSELFPQYLCLASKVCGKLLSIILDLVKDLRSGKSVDMVQLKNLMKMFCGPAFYKSRSFQKRFVACATQFYFAEAIQFHEDSDIAEYLKHVERRLREEKEYCRHLYFFIICKEPLIEAVEIILLRVHAPVILEKGLTKFMDERRLDDLCRMYCLFSEMDLLGLLNDAFNYYIRQTGQKILKEGSSLAEFKRYVDKVCVFLNSDSFKKTAKQCLKDLGMPLKESLKKSLDLQHIQEIRFR